MGQCGTPVEWIAINNLQLVIERKKGCDINITNAGLSIHCIWLFCYRIFHFNITSLLRKSITIILILYDIQRKTVAKLQNLGESSQNPNKQKPNEDSFPTRPEAFGSLSDFATVEGHGRGNRVADKMQIIELMVYLSF